MPQGKNLNNKNKNKKRNRNRRVLYDGIKITQCDNPDLSVKKILLRRRNKVIISTTKSVTDTLFQNLKERIHNEEFQFVEFSINVNHDEEKNIFSFEIFKNNDLIYQINYYNNELIENNLEYKSNDSERIELLKNLINVMYMEEYEKMKKMTILSATFNKNLESLGYCMDEKLYMRISTLNEDEFDKIGKEIISNLKELIGANVKYVPLFPNFPRQVIDMTSFETFICQMIHYWSCNGNIVGKEENREKKPIKFDKKFISVGNESEIHELFLNLMKSAEALSPTDYSDICIYFQRYPEYMKNIPEIFTNKENLATIIYIILCLCKDDEKQNYLPSFEEISKRFSTTTDVLRLTAVLSGQNASLENNIRFKSFSNKERRLIMNLLNNCNNRVEDFSRHRNEWERVCERIHPGKFKKTHAQLVDDLLGVYKYSGRIKKITKNNIYFKIKKYIDNYNKSLEISINNDNKYECGYNNSILYCNRYKYDDIYLEDFMNDVKMRKELLKEINEKKSELGPKFVENIVKIFTSYSFCITNDFSKMINKKILIECKDELNASILQAENEAERLEKEKKKYILENQRFSSKLQYELRNKEYEKTIETLTQRPGEFARHLNEIIVKYDNHDKILQYFERIASNVSIKVLLSVKGYFSKRCKEINERVIVIKGKNPKYHLITKSLKPLEKELCDKICRLCENALIGNFEEKPKLGNVYIDKEWKKQILPQDLRGMDQSLEYYTKGSRFGISRRKLSSEEREELLTKLKESIKKNDEKKSELMVAKLVLEDEDELNKTKNNISRCRELNEKINNIDTESQNINNEIIKYSQPDIDFFNKIRCYIWWNNTTRSGLIIDLSIMVFNDKYEELTQVSWTHLKDNKFQIFHSGDYIHTNGSEGVAEFIDLDPDVIFNNGGRFVAFNVLSYCGIPFKNLNCKFGWMERDDIRNNINQAFEPQTVKQKFDISSEGKSVIPIIFDCLTKEFVWINTSVKGGVTIQACKSSIIMLLKYYCGEMLKENMYNLVEMHTKARGGEIIESVEDLKDGDTAFVMKYPYKKIDGVKYIRPTDLDIIMSEYMT